MRKSPILLLLLPIVFVACVSQRKYSANINLESNRNLQVVVDDSSDFAKIRFATINTSVDSIFIHNHNQIHIEQFVDGQWVKLRILNCPCGAPCAKPAEFIAIAPQGRLTFTWDKKQSWCGAKKSHGIPETLTQPVTLGRYRVLVVFSTDKRTIELYYKEFSL
ncbi:MAG: hypothetical protein H6536_04495 [Bacteroidales bacterium]|nr:hypothetical protein [Bacteroidales bacterium]